MKGIDRAVLRDALRYREIRDNGWGGQRPGDPYARGVELDRIVDGMMTRRRMEKTLEAADRAGSLPNSGQPGYSSGGFEPLPDHKIREGGMLKKKTYRETYEEDIKKQGEARELEDYSGL